MYMYKCGKQIRGVLWGGMIRSWVAQSHLICHKFWLKVYKKEVLDTVLVSTNAHHWGLTSSQVHVHVLSAYVVGSERGYSYSIYSNTLLL